MAIHTKVQSIDKDLIVRLTGQDPATRSAQLAAFARAKLSEADEQNRSVSGHAPPHKTFVDNREGLSEDQVKPDGVILYEFQIALDLFKWIADQLQRHSPVKSGRFQRSFAFYADGAEVDVDGEIPPNASEYAFLNTQPYSRKIEGSDSRPPESKQAPDGVFQAIATLARAEFSNNIARITFAYRSPIGGAIGEWTQTASARRLAANSHGGNKALHTEWLTRVPAIIITMRS